MLKRLISVFLLFGLCLSCVSISFANEENYIGYEVEPLDLSGWYSQIDYPDTPNIPSDDFSESQGDDSTVIPEFVPGAEPEEYPYEYPDYTTLTEDDTSFIPKGDLESMYGVNLKYQTTAKNQGANGLCWVFGSMSCLESEIKKKYGVDENLSEMHAAYSLSKGGGNDSQGTRNQPSLGGSRSSFSAYMTRGTDLSGVVLEENDKYSTSLLKDRPVELTRAKEKSYTADDVIFLTSYKKSEGYDVVVKNAIKSYGAVGAAIFWDAGSYNRSTASYYYSKNKNVNNAIWITNHIVCIVGWDDDFSKENFKSDDRPSTDGAWLVKNSWGTSWGDKGYFWVSYEDTNFPMDTFVFDGIEEYDSTQYTYETDYRCTGSSVYVESDVSESYFAKRFTLNSSVEEINAAKTFISTPYTTISADVVPISKGVDIQEFLKSYKFSAKGSKKTTFAGWYTVDFDNIVRLEGEGTEFLVIIKLSVDEPAKMLRIGYDSYNSKGESWGSVNCTDWGQLGKNACIKAISTIHSDNRIFADNVKLDAYKAISSWEQQIPEVVVEKDGKVLTYDKDYTISYARRNSFTKDFKSYGTISVLVSGIGDYSGIAEKKYVIESRPFIDVKSGVWYEEAAHYAYCHDLMSGTGNKTFDPNGKVTRAQVAQVLYNIADRPVEGTYNFKDIKYNDWYYKSVTWCASSGIVSGVGDNKFAPNDSITREQMATMLYRYAGSPDVSGISLDYIDSEDISSWAINPIKWATSEGIMSGIGGGKVNPRGTAKRSELATILMKYLG